MAGTWLPRVAWAVGASLASLCLPSAPVRAHPHVWINAVATFVFADRLLVGVRHRWEFDELFSSMIIEDYDVDGDGSFDVTEIASVRENAFSNLRDYDYFTHMRLGGSRQPLTEVSEFTARVEEGVLVYEFTLPLPAPIDPDADGFALGVYDPEYYVELLLDPDDPVRFEGIADGGCTYVVREDEDHPIYYGMVYPLMITLSCATS